MTTGERKKAKVLKPRIREVPAVSRAIAILRLLGSEPDPLGVKAIAISLSLVPSTCLHILRVLVGEGLVKVDTDTKRYALGSGMLSLARSVIERSGFPSLVQPVLDRLAQAWGITTIGVEVQSNDHLVVLAIARSNIPFGLHVDVGQGFPALVSATGRLVAAFGDQNWTQLKSRFKSIRWDRPVDFNTWKDDVELAKKRGFSVDRDRYINGVTIVAVPLLDALGRTRYTIVGAGLSEQLDSAKIATLAKEMQQEVKGLSKLILPRG